MKEVDSTSPISGQNLENVAITGEGIIDGGGDAWRPMKRGKTSDAEWNALVQSGGVVIGNRDAWWPSRAAMEGEKCVGGLRTAGSLKLEDYEPYHQYLRPKMLRLIDCKKILLEGVTFENPPAWTLNPALCQDVSILNVTVHNSPAAQNSDALDVESCRHVVIQNCAFEAGDDGICIKSGKDASGRRIGVPTEDVVIEGCTVFRAHGGFTIGSEMSGGVRNIRVNNCTFIGTDVGLRFKSARGRGGVVENIFITNVRMLNIAGDAINFNMYYRNPSPSEEAPAMMETNPPPVNEGTPRFRDIQIENVICRGAHRAVVVEGLPEMPIRDIELKNVSITARGGVYLTDAEGISLDHVQIYNQLGAVLNFVRVKNSMIDDLGYPVGAGTFISASGTGIGAISIKNTDITSAKTGFNLSNGAMKSDFQLK